MHFTLGASSSPAADLVRLGLARAPIHSLLTQQLCSLSEIEEKGVRMKLTVIDTPGFGDHINNENW